MPAFHVRLCFGRFYCVLAALLLSTLFVEVVPAAAQSELATVFGRVTDSSGAVITGAQVEVRNVDTGISISSATNADGLYTVPSLHPGHYVISVRKPGFRSVSATGLELNVQDNVARNFSLQVGSAAESVTVTAEGTNINTTDATVSTVVDRQFTENLPMNGRSFQTLIQLTPGVVLTPSTAYDAGQFSVNGQRTDANYWSVDGVSANIGVGVSALGYPGGGAGGAIPGFSAQGGTNSLVSIDALQEFRIQTSTYAPEFGRTPGAQISIATRSGTNQFHGTVFDYFRNDILDANDWFADRDHLPKPEERQNDFGGTLGGRLWQDHTFFFLSYEGLRLRLPTVAQTTVPSLSARQQASPELQPYFAAYPLPSAGVADTGSDSAPLNASFSNRSNLDAYSLRVDHSLNEKLTFFGRYSYSPSDLVQRGFSGLALNDLFTTKITTQTLTLGATSLLSSTLNNDFRFNYSRVNAEGTSALDDFGGAVPLKSLPFPSPYTAQNSLFVFHIFSLTGGALEPGFQVQNVQRQYNIVDGLSMQEGSHALKFGADFRRLTPIYHPQSYAQIAGFLDVAAAESGNLFFSDVFNDMQVPLLFRNLGLFAQDTWKLSRRLTMTYGLRWDVDFAPQTASGPSLIAAANFHDPATLALAPQGTPPFRTTYGNIAPRVGLAYQLRQSSAFATVFRGGAGVFFDLATQEVGDNFNDSYPFGASNFSCCFNGSFPLNPATAAPPPITSDFSSGGTFFAFNPHFQLPYTLEWNVAIEQGLGPEQSVTGSYIGSAGRRLIQEQEINAPNPNIAFATLVSNTATSDYDALQLQFQRHLSHGFQALASYTWSHSIDTGSASTRGNVSNFLVLGEGQNANRGPSDFDIRHAFTAGLTYNLPRIGSNRAGAILFHDWSLQTVLQVRTAPPIDIYNSNFFTIANGGVANVRPDIVPGQPFYLFGAQYPGGKAFNPAAFTDPPTDANGNPVRQGDLARNALRGFGAAQWDVGVHRDFQVLESLKLQFRAELFNVLNHPSFAPPVADLGQESFGQSIQTLGTYLNGGTIAGNVGGGAFAPLYQLGGPRSVQLALKVQF